MKKVYTYCDGGLGNRINSLLGGLYLSKKLNYDFEIFWPLTQWCNCQFDDLFEPTIKHTIGTLDDIFLKENICLFLTHELSYKAPSHVKVDHFTSMNTIDFNNFSCDLVYNNSLFPYFLSTELNVEMLKELKIKKDIVNRVENFVNENKIDYNVIGIHVRKTDNPVKFDDESYMKIINGNKDKRFFVCSDDESIEKTVSELPNVIVNKKNNYVKKITDNDDWRSNNGKNIFREKESVIDGFVDMLILSRTNSIKLSFSTFFDNSKLYNKINIFNQ